MVPGRSFLALNTAVLGCAKVLVEVRQQFKIHIAAVECGVHKRNIFCLIKI